MGMSTQFNGPKMRERRRAANLEMAELAALLEKATGRRWHRNHLYGVESGRLQPGLKLSHAIAEALDLPWDQLWADAPAAARPRQAARS